MTKVTSILLVFLALVYPSEVIAKNIYLVRHFEKVKGVSNPNLTPVGHQRAEQLAHLLLDKKISVIYSTSYVRTLATARPLSKLANLSILAYDPTELSAFAQQLIETDNNVLVVGHSNTTPQLIRLLGGDQVKIAESEFGELFTLSFGDNLVTTTSTIVTLKSNSE